MRHETTATHSHNEATAYRDRLRSDLVICLDDYVRLREIVGDHDLAEELDRAIVAPSDRIPESVKQIPWLAGFLYWPLSVALCWA